MSHLKDAQGNIVPRPSPQTLNGNGTPRYKDQNCTELDWFDTHPQDRPKPIQEILETSTGTVSFETTDGVKGEATLPLVPASPALVAGNTTASLTASNQTANLPQTAVKSE